MARGRHALCAAAAAQGLTEEGALASGHKDLDIYTTSFRPMRNTLSGSPIRTFMKVRRRRPLFRRMHMKQRRGGNPSRRAPALCSLACPQVVVDAHTRKLLGAHMVGDHAAEIMQVIHARGKQAVSHVVMARVGPGRECSGA